MHEEKEEDVHEEYRRRHRENMDRILSWTNPVHKDEKPRNLLEDRLREIEQEQGKDGVD